MTEDDAVEKDAVTEDDAVGKAAVTEEDAVEKAAVTEEDAVGKAAVTEPVLSHVGICVSDLERSTRFYCDALGFTKAESHTVGDEFARLMGLHQVALTSQFLRRGERALELLRFDEPEAGSGDDRPIHTHGLTHLSFLVDDVDEVARRVARLGGTVHDETRTSFGEDRELDFVYCSDPDGTPVELMRLGS